MGGEEHPHKTNCKKKLLCEYIKCIFWAARLLENLPSPQIGCSASFSLKRSLAPSMISPPQTWQQPWDGLRRLLSGCLALIGSLIGRLEPLTSGNGFSAPLGAPVREVLTGPSTGCLVSAVCMNPPDLFNVTASLVCLCECVCEEILQPTWSAIPCEEDAPVWGCSQIFSQSFTQFSKMKKGRIQTDSSQSISQSRC